jgi:enamine deaminase RidA (YjgF/YER057c/UK114 family)
MELSRYNPPALGEPLGQYSHVTKVKAAELLFIAGQLSSGSSIGEQCDGVFAAIAAALRSAKADWQNVVQFTTYLIDPDLIPAFMEWRLATFPRLFGAIGYPPNTLLVVKQLVDPKFLLEVQTVAAL